MCFSDGGNSTIGIMCDVVTDSPFGVFDRAGIIRFPTLVRANGKFNVVPGMVFVHHSRSHNRIGKVSREMELG